MADEMEAMRGADDEAWVESDAHGVFPPLPPLAQAREAPSPRWGEGGAGARSIDEGEVRRAYELSNESVESIRERFGLTKHQLRKMQRDGGWTMRPQISMPGALRGRKAVGEGALDLRLNRLVVFSAAMLEKQVVRSGLTFENAQALRELCRAQEARVRTTKNRNAARDREKKNKDAGYDFRDDSAWLDAELDRILEPIRGPGKRDHKSAALGDECGEAGVSGELAQEGDRSASASA
jgi:hypothetical protein